jgi:hypothetical protein
MKIRNGFVSNSSSSSFVICLPDDFDIDLFNIEEKINKLDDYDELSIDSIKETILRLIEDEELYQEECDGDEFYALTDIFEDYIIARMESGSDNGQIVIADNKSIKKILKNENKKRFRK